MTLVLPVRLFVNAVALWAATRLVPAIEYTDGYLSFLGVTLIFGVVNAVVGKPAKILAFPLTLTLGLFLVVVNGLMLCSRASSPARSASAGTSEAFGRFWGALVVVMASTLLEMVIADKAFSITHPRSWGPLHD